ncbi:MAG TPA: hypothetical protein PKK59_07805 [Anaerolineaceae bacterium]|nr:hypothetical protein [Anaerolineaceae bacterium]
MENISWQDLRNEVNKVENKSPSWKSDQQSLLTIIDWAEKHDIDPPQFNKNKIEITKLRSIIKHAKKAIAIRDLQKLSTLFDWVTSLTTIELRHKLGISETEIIEYTVESEGDEIVSFVLTIRPDQLDRIASLTKSRFKYTPKEHSS